jgi:hypothetical protein
MELLGWLQHSQELSLCPYLEQDQSNPYDPILSLQDPSYYYSPNYVLIFVFFSFLLAMKCVLYVEKSLALIMEIEFNIYRRDGARVLTAFRQPIIIRFPLCLVLCGPCPLICIYTGIDGGWANLTVKRFIQNACQLPCGGESGKNAP